MSDTLARRLEKIADELPALAAFVRENHGQIGWEYQFGVWERDIRAVLLETQSLARGVRAPALQEPTLVATWRTRADNIRARNETLLANRAGDEARERNNAVADTLTICANELALERAPVALQEPSEAPDLTQPGEGPWRVLAEYGMDTRGESYPTWWVHRKPSWYLAQFDSEREAIAVCAALNWVARSAPAGGQP